MTENEKNLEQNSQYLWNILFSRRSVWVLLELVGRWTQTFKPKSTKRHVTNLYLEPHDYRIYYVNIDLRHQYGISAAESQTFLHAKRPQRRRARRNGCFRRLPFCQRMNCCIDHTLHKVYNSFQISCKVFLGLCASKNLCTKKVSSPLNSSNNLWINCFSSICKLITMVGSNFVDGCKKYCGIGMWWLKCNYIKYSIWKYLKLSK